MQLIFYLKTKTKKKPLLQHQRGSAMSALSSSVVFVGSLRQLLPGFKLHPPHRHYALSSSDSLERQQGLV